MLVGFLGTLILIGVIADNWWLVMWSVIIAVIVLATEWWTS